MLKALLLTSGLLASLASGYTVEPPAPADPSTIQDCTSWAVVESSDTCQTIIDWWYITIEQFKAYNPVLGSACTLITGNAYCVEQNWGLPPVVTTTSAVTKTSASATPTNGVTTPSPIQTGMVTNCATFHRVVEGDGCWDLANTYKINLDDFYAWNPAVGTDCAHLLRDTYVCVALISSGTVTATGPASTTTGNGIATPSPTQSGISSSCTAFHKVVKDENCETVAAAAGISLKDFYSWNLGVGDNCQFLQLGTYACISVIGYVKPTTTSAASTPTATNGIATPSPIQTGMVTNCAKFYQVKSGDGCYDIAASYSITLEAFYSYNPAVKTDCSGLWPTYYVCVGIIGGSGTVPSTTTKPTTTSTPGNGIATPTPIQTGMVSNCNKFYSVKTGDSCYDIAASYSITLAAFYSFNPAVKNDCSGLWPTYYVCVGVTSGTGVVTTTLATTTRAGNGVATPTPIQTGMTTSCKSFYYVKTGDGCYAIAEAAKISLTDFYAWNPAVKNDCSGLWPNYYVCIAKL